MSFIKQWLALFFVGIALPTICMQAAVMDQSVGKRAGVQLLGTPFSDYEGVQLPKNGNNFVGSLISQKHRPVETNSILYQFSTAVFSQYKEYCIKATDGTSVAPIVAVEEFSRVLDAFINQYADNGALFLDTKKWIDGKAPTATLLKDLADKNFRHPYAQKMNVQPDSHKELFGDIHGSIHSMLRSLWRLYAKGFIDENLKIVDPKGYIVFLGDLVDRGRYSVEVLYIAMVLSLNNPGNVVIIRGNHEDPKMGINGGLYTVRDEIREKYNKQPDQAGEVIKKLNCLYDLLPHVLFVGCNNHYKIFSHAGIDVSYNFKNLLMNSEAAYECLTGKKEISPFLDEEVRARAIEHFNSVEAMPVGQETQFYCVGFNWCDFAQYRNSTETIHDENKIVFSGYGYNVSLELFDKYMATVNAELLGAGITVAGLIRGHQHMSYGLALFDATKKAAIGQACDWKALVDIHGIQASKGFCMDIRSAIFTLMAAPEGVGRDNAHGIEVHCDNDSLCTITVGATEKEWFIKPMEFEIPVRNKEGIYCTISDSIGLDPIRCSYPEASQPNSVSSAVQQQEENRDEVEAIFQELKNRVKVHPAAYEQDVPLQEHALSYPLDPALKTQSLNHIRIVKGTDIVDQNVIQSFMADATYLPMVENALYQEILHSRDYYVFYHGHENNIACLHDIFKMFYQWGLLRKNQLLPLRFIMQGSYDSTLGEFLDQTKKVIKNANGTYDYIDGDGCDQSTPWFDHVPEVSKQLLAVNYALFGNSTSPGESSFGYFERGHSEHAFDIGMLLHSLCDQLQIPHLFADKIVQETDKYLERSSKSGKLLQIFIKKEAVDDVAYWSMAGGKPIDREILPDWDSAKQRHTKISQLLEKYTENLQNLDTQIKKFHYQGVSHEYYLDADYIQARIWLPAANLYDPTKTKILRYGLDKRYYAEYIASLNAIFQEMIKYFIQQKLAEETALWQYAGTPLCALDDVVSQYKAKKEARKAEQVLDYCNIEAASSRAVSPEANFLMLANKIRQQGVDDASREQLKAVVPLCKHLPGGVTPLIYAVKINCKSLVHELLQMQSVRSQILLCDCLNRTVFDWYNLCGYQDAALLNRLVTALLGVSDVSKVSGVVIRLVGKTVDAQVLRVAMLIVDKLLEKNVDQANDIVMAILDKNNDPEICKVAIGIAEQLAAKGLVTHACCSAQVIVNKSDDPEIFKWAMGIAKQLADKGLTKESCDLAKAILAKSNDKEICKMAMSIAEQCAGLTPQAYSLALGIINKLNDPEILKMAIGVVKGLIAKEQADAAYSLVQIIVNKSKDPEILKYIMSIATEYVPNGQVNGACLLAKVIVTRSKDLEMLKSVIGIVKKLDLKSADVYCLTHAIVNQAEDPQICKFAMEIADELLTKEDAIGSFCLVTAIIEKFQDPETLQWAFDSAMRFFDKGKVAQAHRLAETIANKTNDPEMHELVKAFLGAICE